MRIAFAPVVAAALVLLCSPVSALEKRSVPFDDTRADAWTSGATCRASYYNICTGWVWCWDDFTNEERLGIVVDTCCGPNESAALCQSTHFVCSAPPGGYGFTGTIGVFHVDANDCPVGPPIHSQPYMPSYVMKPFSIVPWGCVPVPSRFALVITLENPFGWPISFGTDHPATGPSGPQACGVCYPANRQIHSFRYGNVYTPVCPGSTFNDGVCDAELFWDVDFACTVSLQESSWGSIKALYH